MIVILTALESEHAGVAERMSQVVTRRLATGTRFDIGVVGEAPGHQVAVASTGIGAGAAAALTAVAITEFRPSAVLFVGVAGGLHDWLELGDVVVATRVYNHQGARVDPDQVNARPRAWDAGHDLEQTARHVSRRVPWYDGPDPAPQVHFDPIATGDQVLNHRDSDVARRLREHFNDAVAIEMESSGMAQAGHLLHATPTLTIRGISDFADGAKDRADAGGSQPRAARNAAAFACALVAHLAPDAHHDPAASADAEPALRVHNSASGNARVGLQAGIVHGSVHLGGQE